VLTFVERCAALIAAGGKPTVLDVSPLVREYVGRPGNIAGGSLHIVLDDRNVDNLSVKYCGRWAEERGDADGAALASLLLACSKTQRKKTSGRW
jgi:hypothetical protein